ncbi:hypothetical protein VTN49DRAFT_2155 [Thermomyces lanuginosus]|uniref:uncharacterized protein n=1 Tax=Thermomyces lanuginosus TaxID=5541 RepID=UPI0037444777
MVTPSMLKKRKRDGGGQSWPTNDTLHSEPVHFLGDHMMSISPPRHFSSSSDFSARFSSPVPQKKRRILQPQSQFRQTSPGSQGRKLPSSPSMMSGACIDMDENNVHDYDSATRHQRSSPEVSPRTVPATTTTLPPPVLRPCHVCHRRPTTRAMLDAYADCELCGERACYICLRECDALGCGLPSSVTSSSVAEEVYLRCRQQQRRRRKICSCCAVEGLTESGEEVVWCVECVRRER